MTEAKTRKKNEHGEVSLPVPKAEPKKSPTVPPVTMKWKTPDPFGSSIDFAAQVGGWPKGVEHKGLKAAHGDITASYPEIAETYKRMMQNQVLSPAQRHKAAAETCNQMQRSLLMRTDRRLQKATEEADELRAKLEREHLSGPRDAAEAVAFQEIRQYLQQHGAEVFTSVFEAAKHGDALTVRALLTAPAILQPKSLSKDGRDAIRRVYLQRVANEEQLLLEGLDKGIGAVQRAGQVLMSRLGDAIDFQSAARLAEAEKDAARLQKAAAENLRDTKLELT